MLVTHHLVQDQEQQHRIRTGQSTRDDIELSPSHIHQVRLRVQWNMEQ
uniref:Uncharacterized protein n=1 Tax=Setaria viridis TaxID=4556 RepID=A0A4U6U642_SETVI|nr:hypothetical protein SEVIR_6G051750v2 [Setaria viridis]